MMVQSFDRVLPRGTKAGHPMQDSHQAVVLRQQATPLRFEHQATVSRQPFAPIQAHLQTVHRWTQRPSPSAFLLLVQDLVIGQPRDSPPQAIVTNRVALIMFVIEPSRNVGRLYKRRPNNNSLDGRTWTCRNQYFIAF